jgi:hypothetical protein
MICSISRWYAALRRRQRASLTAYASKYDASGS